MLCLSSERRGQDLRRLFNPVGYNGLGAANGALFRMDSESRSRNRGEWEMGHIIADALGGSMDPINFFPQHKEIIAGQVRLALNELPAATPALATAVPPVGLGTNCPLQVTTETHHMLATCSPQLPIALLLPACLICVVFFCCDLQWAVCS